MTKHAKPVGKRRADSPEDLAALKAEFAHDIREAVRETPGLFKRKRKASKPISPKDIEPTDESSGADLIAAFCDAYERGDITGNNPRAQALLEEMRRRLFICIGADPDGVIAALGIKSKSGRPTNRDKQIEWAASVFEMVQNNVAVFDAINRVAAEVFKGPDTIRHAYDEHRSAIELITKIWPRSVAQARLNRSSRDGTPAPSQECVPTAALHSHLPPGDGKS
jgi:hypothetical protein